MGEARPGVCVSLNRPKNETPEHWAAKMHAWVWLWRQGCRHIGFEVEATPSWKVDVLGIDIRRGNRLVYVVEAKGHRSDWLADLNADKAALAAFGRLEKAHAAAVDLGVLEPDLYDEPAMYGRGTLSEKGHAVTAYQKARRTASKRGSVAGGFEGRPLRFLPAPHKLGCADLARVSSARYVVAPAGVVAVDELPTGWGLLEAGEHPRSVRKVKPEPVSEDVVFSLVGRLALMATYRTKASFPGGERGADVALLAFDEIVQAERARLGA